MDDQMATVEDVQNRSDWIKELAKLDRIDALDAAQKAKVKCDNEGDENTSFFHGLLKQHRRLQMVQGIMHDGEWCTDHEQVKRTFLEFYYDKFTAGQFVTPNLPQSRCNHLSAKEIKESERPVTIDEIKYVVWQCGSDESPARISVLVNRSPTGEIDLHRGLRQGDPLSPFLFIIAMEGLHIAIEKAIEDNKISGTSIGVDRVKVCHLFYLDDVVFLTEWTTRDVVGILNVLNEFYNSSALKINVGKSNMYGVGVSLDEIANMAASTGCAAGNLPFSYLGITIGASMATKGRWDNIVQRFKDRLSKWKANMLSIGGRLTLIKSVLGSLGIYYMSLFRVPEDSREISRVKIGTWARIIGSVNYLHDKHILDHHTLRYNLVSGDKLWFWKDFWLDDQPLSTRFPRLFRLENDQNCLVRHQWINGHWWWDSRRDVREGTEYQQLQLLTQAISHVALREGQDKLWWDIDIQGMFSVGNTRKFIDNQTLLGSNIATRWCSSLPRKVNIFMWRARLNKLPTRHNLSRKGIKIASIMCPVCGVSMELLSHVLFTCTIAKEVWKGMYNWCQVYVMDINDLSEWFDWCDHNSNVRDRKVKNQGH
ncbi:RNA-directed DNA polymerase, eukaryota, reverse transcriptase zinc-binding domain protein, partial [Tanacetum coccineum]